jgi:5-(carboxyamino)imidazole ribonucleotide synthase
MDFQGEYKPIEITENNVFLKMYGKKISKPLRKLGHLNLVGNQGETIDDLVQKITSLKDKTQVFPLN